MTVTASAPHDQDDLFGARWIGRILHPLVTRCATGQEPRSRSRRSPPTGGVEQHDRIVGHERLLSEIGAPASPGRIAAHPRPQPERAATGHGVNFCFGHLPTRSRSASPPRRHPGHGRVFVGADVQRSVGVALLPLLRSGNDPTGIMTVALRRRRCLQVMGSVTGWRIRFFCASRIGRPTSVGRSRLRLCAVSAVSSSSRRCARWCFGR